MAEIVLYILVTTACVLAFAGLLYQIINQESAKLLAQEKKFIDRQSDLGIEGLRTAKQRYHPHHMIEVQHMVPCSEVINEEEPEHY